ncbi:MAG TPA: UV DNA damage repair endonuclease UvsE [Planctomycetaceae bacterium]|nr:UV DNA damage repair endonuclease UvsE [Planctomycetaceae bacterium]
MSHKTDPILRKKPSLAVQPMVTPRSLRHAILDAVEERRPGGTVCPSEVARSLWPGDWRDHMEEVRQAASELCAAELLETTQRGKPITIGDVPGPIRLRARELSPLSSAFPGRLGLCCQFAHEPIKFRTTTASSLARLPRPDQLQKLSVIILSNVEALRSALHYCAAHGIGAFRIASTLLPVKTHPAVGYQLDDLPASAAIRACLEECRTFAADNHLRTSFHPDQFVVLNSPRREVVERSIEDLAVHTELAELVGADVINIHGGGGFGDKRAALDVLTRQIEQLPHSIRDRLTLENDDRVFTPSDLLPVCRATGVPLVYDVHHHRCLPDGLSVAEATEAALTTWNREPLFHLSSPLLGWSGPQPERHHDDIEPRDFPSSWLSLPITVDVEAKAKETAVLRLLAYLKPT